MTLPTQGLLVITARECVAEILEAPLAEIPGDANLRQDLDVDSLQQLELVTMLEDRFGVLLDADDLSEVDSIEDLAARTLRKLGLPG